MESFFIDPSSLPGGRAWAIACANVVQSSVDGAPYESASLSTAFEALRCHTSSVGGFIQVLLLLVVYGGILFKASELIAHGSELLLIVPSLRHIIGSVVLPILGAVPDGAIVLFSGLGPNAQEELAVGVGALAGSTSMLLTVPWFLAICAGRVNIRADGVLTYHYRKHKLTPSNFDINNTGVQPKSMVRISGRIMMLTAVSYFVIQGAALVSGTFYKSQENADSIRAAAKIEYWPAVVCCAVAFSFFVWYLYDQVTSSSEEERDYFETYVDEIKQRAIRSGEVSLTGAFQEIWTVASDADESTGLVVEQHKKHRLQGLLKRFFISYDRDNDECIDRLELSNLMRDLGEYVSGDELVEMFNFVDRDSDGRVTLEEFVEFMPKFIISRARSRANDITQVSVEDGSKLEGENNEDGEDEEVPEDLRHLDPESQIRHVMYRSFKMMAFGTALVLIFSDPMVSVLSDVGARLGIPAFYVSFVLAPLASNASELLAAYSYAKKKTRKTVTIAFSTLLGAAIMNNTFVLAIFMSLLAVKGLAWTFTAETISILFVLVCLGVLSQKKVLTFRDGFCALLVYPVSLLLVALLENVFGLD